MGKRTIFVFSLVGMVLLALFVNTNVAQSKSETELKIAIVSVKRIFDECKSNIKFKGEMAAEQEKIMAEIQKSRAEYDAELAGLKTIKTGSTEYMARMKELITKKANLSAQQEFYSQQIAMKERQWILEIYNEIINITKEMARERGLDLVMENSEIDLSNIPDEALVMSILMRAAIYTEGCVDITDDVMSRLDADK